MKKVWILLLILVIGSAFAGCQATRAGYESAPYRLVRASGKFELRGELAAGRFAVLRFSGGRNAKNEAESLEKLRAWMKQEGWKELSPPIYGYFDPPWTPAFLRRNEVMARVEFTPQD